MFDSLKESTPFWFCPNGRTTKLLLASSVSSRVVGLSTLSSTSWGLSLLAVGHDTLSYLVMLVKVHRRVVLESLHVCCGDEMTTSSTLWSETSVNSLMVLKYSVRFCEEQLNWTLSVAPSVSSEITARSRVAIKIPLIIQNVDKINIRLN